MTNTEHPAAAVTVHYIDGRTDTSYFDSVVDATTLAADTAERIDVVKVTVTGTYGVLTLTHTAR